MCTLSQILGKFALGGYFTTAKEKLKKKEYSNQGNFKL